MVADHALLASIYDAFNARQIDTVLNVLHPEVKWANGWEGGYVTGHDAVRNYWTRQWAEIDPTVTPEAFEDLPDGAVKVRVHARVRDRTGALLSDTMVTHTYRFRAGKVDSMEIGAADDTEAAKA